MIPDNRQRQLWELANDYRSSNPHHFDLFDLADFIRDEGVDVDLDDLRFLVRRFDRGRGEAVPSAFLTRFIAELLASREAVSALDPAAGMGWIAAGVSQAGRISQFDAITTNPNSQRLRAQLPAPPRYRLHVGNVSEHIDSLTPPVDALVSMPPVGRRGERHCVDLRIRDDESLLLLMDVERCLAEDGVIVWIVPSRFAFEHSPTSVRRTLSKVGLHLTALLRLPPAAVLPTTGLGLELAVIERTRRELLFVAEVPENADAQDQLITRLRRREAGPQPAQGRLILEREFAGLGALEATERVERLARSSGLIRVAFSRTILEVNRPRRRNGVVERPAEHPDAVYLPEMARTEAATSQSSLPERLQSYLQLVVNREEAEPEYLAGMFNTPLGFALREAASTGAIAPRISTTRLAQLALYLPPLSDQRRVVQANKSITQLRTELTELETRLWDKPRRASEVLQALTQVNHEDRFGDWIESLPFPLASILRVYHAVDQTDASKYARLLHFFEALAEFLAIIHLSAYRTDNELWQGVHRTLHMTLVDYSRPFDRPTFGVWKSVNDVLAVDARRLLNDASQEGRILEAYRLTDSRPLEQLCAKSLLGALQDSNTARNRWTGHGGAVGSEEAIRRHTSLSSLLEKVRPALGAAFAYYELIEPGESRILPGPVYQCSVRRLVGSNPHFERGDVELRDVAITGQLYLHSEGHSRVLELVPLVQMRAAPQPACYFYNRLENRTPHLVSYHFGDKSEDIDHGQSTQAFLDALSAPPVADGNGTTA